MNSGFLLRESAFDSLGLIPTIIGRFSTFSDPRGARRRATIVAFSTRVVWLCNRHTGGAPARGFGIVTRSFDSWSVVRQRRLGNVSLEPRWKRDCGNVRPEMIDAPAVVLITSRSGGNGGPGATRSSVRAAASRTKATPAPSDGPTDRHLDHARQSTMSPAFRPRTYDCDPEANARPGGERDTTAAVRRDIDERGARP